MITQSIKGVLVAQNQTDHLKAQMEPSVAQRYESIIREKDDIIQAQYAEIASLRERLALGVRLLNEIAGIPTPATTPVGDSRLAEMYNEAEAPTSSNIGHG